MNLCRLCCTLCKERVKIQTLRSKPKPKPKKKKKLTADHFKAEFEMTKQK